MLLRSYLEPVMLLSTGIRNGKSQLLTAGTSEKVSQNQLLSSIFSFLLALLLSKWAGQLQQDKTILQLLSFWQFCDLVVRTQHLGGSPAYREMGTQVIHFQWRHPSWQAKGGYGTTSLTSMLWDYRAGTVLLPTHPQERTHVGRDAQAAPCQK